MNFDFTGNKIGDAFREDCTCDCKTIFNALINTSVDSVMITDPKGKILDISANGLNLFSFNERIEAVDYFLMNLVAAEDYKNFCGYFEQVQKGGKGSAAEFKFLKKNKDKFYGEINSTFIEGSQSNYLIVIIRDITKYKFEQKKHEAIYEISESAGTSRNLDELYAKVHKVIKDLIPAENFYISIYNEQSDTLSFPYYMDVHDAPENAQKYGPQQFGNGLTEYAIKIGKPLLINRLQQIELLSENKIKQIGELSSEWLGVPLKTIDGNTIGLLAVQIYEDNIGYSQSDIDILSFVSTQIAMAIEKKKKEESLIQLKKAVESSGESIFITDTAGIIRYVNPEFTKLYGYQSEEVIGKTTPRILKSGLLDSEIYVQFWSSLLNKQTVKGELVNRTKEGKIINIEGSANTIVDDEDKIVGFLCVQHSIDERKESEKIKNALYKISEAANVTSDLSTLYVNIHEIVKELMPVRNFYISLFDPGTELISFPYFIDEYDPPQKPKKAGKGLTEYVLRTGKSILIDEEKNLELKRKGEVDVIGTPSKIWLGVPLKIFEKVTGVMVVQDYENPNIYGEREREILAFVSEQIAAAIYKKSVEQELLEFTTELQNNKQLLEIRTEELSALNSQLERSEKELQELNSAKDRYFSIIAHDLKSPFNGLLGFSNMLIQDFEQFNKNEVKSYLKHLNSSIKHIFNLVENLLDWSRIQTGKLEYNPEMLILKDNAASALSLLESNSLSKNIRILMEIDENIDVFADKKMLTSVLQNLISNSIKFTRPGGEIRISSIKDNGCVKISICDNGVGIEAKRLQDLFKIDKQTSTDGTSKEKGTGLGLILCKEFVEKCGGNISVESEIGKGTVFTFTMPVTGNN